jgi:hypothetical protein
VTFPHIPCTLLSVDAMDVSGSHQLDVSHHIIKKPLDKYGAVVGEEIKHELGNTLQEKDVKDYAAAVQSNSTDSTPPPPPPPVVVIDPTKVPGYCGSCYGAELHPGQCCNTCDEVRDVYRARGWALANLNSMEQCVASGQTQDAMLAELARGDGCRMYGYLEVNKVAGNIHWAPGKSFQHAHMHIHDLAAFPPASFNVSHKITQFSFGEPFPGIINPLDHSERMLGLEDGGGMYMYYVKVVPTTYDSLAGGIIHTNQFSVTEHFRPVSAREGQGLPGVFFFYELSPIMVQFTEERKSLLHFLTQLCAILGGVFTVSGMLDRVVSHIYTIHTYTHSHIYLHVQSCITHILGCHVLSLSLFCSILCLCVFVLLLMYRSTQRHGTWQRSRVKAN